MLSGFLASRRRKWAKDGGKRVKMGKTLVLLRWAWQSNTTWSASDLRVASHLEMVYGGKLDAPTAKALAGKAQRVKYRLRPTFLLGSCQIQGIEKEPSLREQVQELWRHQPHRYPNATERTISRPFSARCSPNNGRLPAAVSRFPAFWRPDGEDGRKMA